MAEMYETERVEGVGVGRQLDGVGDGFPGHEGRAHAGRTHGDAVRDHDGVELDGGAAPFADAVLDGFGQLAQVQVAGRDLAPGIDHRDQWARDRGIVQPGGLEHRARWCVVASLLDLVAFHFRFGSSSRPGPDAAPNFSAKKTPLLSVAGFLASG